MEEKYKELIQQCENKIALLNEIAKQYQIAKSKYNFGDRHTWDAYIFWRNKYDIIHEEVVSQIRLFPDSNSIKN